MTSTSVSLEIRHSRRHRNPKRVGSCLLFCDAFVPCGRPSAQMSLSILQKMDVKDAFRRLHVAWEKAPTFAYMVNDLIVVDFRLPFGWRNSPGWWALHASAVRHADCNTSLRTARVLTDAHEIAKNIRVCLLYTSPSPRDKRQSRMPSSA